MCIYIHSDFETLEPAGTQKLGTKKTTFALPKKHDGRKRNHRSKGRRSKWVA